MAETRFKSRFTGAEIEQLLVKAQSSISDSVITDSYTDGKEGTVFSGVGAKALHTLMIDRTSGETLKAAIEAIPNVAVFTEADRAKLTQMSDKFVGAVRDIASRNAIDTSSFVGDEVVFVRSDQDGNPAFFYWDDTNGKWLNAIADGTGNEDVFPTLPIGTNTLTTYPAGGTTCLKFIVHSKNGSNVHTAEVLINTNFANVYYTTYAELKSNPLQPIFNLYAELDSNLNIVIKADVYVANSTIKITKVAEL